MNVSTQRSAGLLAAVLDACGDAVASIDEESRFTTWNPAAEHLFGYSAAEAIGQPVSLIVPADYEADRQAALAQATTHTRALAFETKRRRRDGTLIDVEMKVSPIRDEFGGVIGFVNVIRDLTERKANERRLRTLDHRYRMFFERIPGLTYIYEPSTGNSPTGSLRLSQAFATLTGYPATMGVGESFVETVVHPEDRTRARTMNQHILESNAPFCAEYRILTQDGRVRWVRDQATYVSDDDNEPPYWLGFMLDITEQKLAEAALAVSEVRFRTVFEQAPIGMTVVSPDNRVLRANQAVCTLLGYSEAELQAMTVAAITHPDDIAKGLATAVRTHHDGFDQYDREKRYIRKDGQVVWANLRVSLIADAAGAPQYFICQVQDITERKAAEAEREATHQNMREVLERITDGFFALDRDWRLTYINEAAGRLLPHNRELYLGLNFWDTFPMIQDTAIAEAIHQASATETTTSVAFHYPRLDAWYESRVYPSSRGVSIFFRDVTEQQRAAEEVTAALGQLQRANAELEQLSAAKSDFVSTISHEFRTPLTSIQGFSELIADGAVTMEEAQEFAATINANAVRLGRMISDVLDLDRMEAGRTEAVLGPADLNAVVATVLDNLGPTAPRHSLVAHLDPGLPLITGDADLLERVVTNLVANAIKYSPAGGAIVVTTAHRQDMQDMVELTVADQGLGIPPEHRETIFSRYGRIIRPEQMGIEGTGLGLPIARHILEVHNGRIWADENSPTGSIFHVMLPTAAESQMPTS